MILPLGALLGFGVTSMIYFGASLLCSRPAPPAAAVEFGAIVALLVRLGARGFPRLRGPAARSWTWIDVALGSVFVPLCSAALVVSWRAYRAEPLGGWDGWAIWNMHARFMLRAGTHWPELLGASQLNWTHPDYPRLVPSSVARIWSWSGEETPAGSALVAVSFAIALVALLVAFVARQRGRMAALAGGVLLVATPFLVTFASNQHADIPLASYLFASVALLCLAGESGHANGLWVLAGFAAGCAAWTKNEGLLFAVVISAAVATWLRRKRDARAAMIFFGSLAIALLPVLYFKLRLAPPNDLASPPLGPRLAQLFDGSRHALILKTLWRDLGVFGEWQIAPWLALALPLLVWRRRTRVHGVESFPLVLAALMLGGYYAVYLLSPLDLAWHLNTSLVRLLLQLWPLAIAGWCLLLPSMPDAASEKLFVPFSLRWRAILVALNGALTGAALFALSLQRGAGELAIRRFGFAEVSAMFGDGWFPLERHGRDEWAWSTGRAGLELYVTGDRAVENVRLRFQVAGVGARRVEFSSASRVLWQGVVSDVRTTVSIGPLTLSPGATRIDVTTDTPGAAEPAAAGGRTLAFAIYNVQLR